MPGVMSDRNWGLQYVKEQNNTKVR